MAVEVSGTPCGGPTDTPFDKEMVKGGGVRGRRLGVKSLIDLPLTAQ